MDYYAIGQRIRKIRKARGLSQEKLAKKVGISTTHMSHIETANTKMSRLLLQNLPLYWKCELTNYSMITDQKTVVFL